MPAIFISYRREDSIAYSGRLYDRLTAEFGKGQVFMDIDSIDPGADFIEVIEQTVAACDTVLVVIGRHWLTVADAHGRRRLENPEDFVRLEVETALSRKVHVVPVLVGGAQMPRADELPAALAGLFRRHAFDLQDVAFHQTLDRLINSLRRNETKAREQAELQRSEARAREQVEQERLAQDAKVREQAEQERRKRIERLRERRLRVQESAREQAEQARFADESKELLERLALEARVREPGEQERPAPETDIGKTIKQFQRIENWLGLAGGLAVAGIFLYSGIAKVLQPWPDFALAIDSFHVVPAGWLNLIEPLARTLPWFEIALGLGILLLRGVLLRLSFVIATSMLAFFLLIGIRAVAKGFTVDCGCFGASNRGNIDALWLVEVAAMLALTATITVEIFRRARSLKQAANPGSTDTGLSDLADPDHTLAAYDASYDASSYDPTYDPTPHDQAP